LIKEVVRFSLNQSATEIFVEGNMVIPDNQVGIVIFAHGSGSSKESPRNQLVSEKLNENSIGTLQFDLLSKEEQECDKRLGNIITQVPGATLNKFNISLLSERLSMVTEWVMNYHKERNFKVAYFASSTGAAAALACATKFHVRSVIIRSGRTDLIDSDLLPQIVSPCLLFVGSKDKRVININKQTIKKLINAEKKELNIVPNASHLFEEKGSMETVANISAEWLKNYFRPLIHSLS